jgi:hypothetical protein
MGTAILCLGITTAVVLGVVFVWAQLTLYKIQARNIDMLNAYLNRVFKERNSLGQCKAKDPKGARE